MMNFLSPVDDVHPLPAVTAILAPFLASAAYLASSGIVNYYTSE
jgi:hypothetical protein